MEEVFPAAEAAAEAAASGKPNRYRRKGYELNILVANDDGIEARGMRELVKALTEKVRADVYVFAPDGQRSAASHAITLRSPISVWQVPFEGAKEAFALDGTPADCVAVGLKMLRLKGIDVDVVFAGINHGSNVGTDTVYSGTVGAALEGSIQGVPSAAVSVDSHQATHFDYACDLAVDLINKTGGEWDSRVMININTPDLPADEIKGTCNTVLGEREYLNDVQMKTEGEVTTFEYGGDPVLYESDDNHLDVIALENGYASISPIQKDMTAYNAGKMLEDWRIGK